MRRGAGAAAPTEVGEAGGQEGGPQRRCSSVTPQGLGGTQMAASSWSPGH